MKTVIFGLLFLCQLVDHHVTMNFNVENRYDNGYPETQYHHVLNTFQKLYQVEANRFGGTFHILRDWTDGAVNAWAWRIGKEYWIEVPGGMSRYHLISEEGFIATLCHEAGHLFGGSPHRSEISLEGQADYFSTMKCMEKVFRKLGYSEDSSIDKKIKCKGDFCSARLKGALSLSSYYAELAKVNSPSLSSPDTSVVQRTLRTHPKPQCRFDTMVSGIRCDNRDDFSWNDELKGSCKALGARPLCWFNPSK
ncbi:MAG: hypothetical protein NXH75_15600 [Halobacteriovoraceae bacterium]|nr:hypothetical protein [Halobacteriovoraceae bacterium]